jgi:hypothetical protein
MLRLLNIGRDPAETHHLYKHHCHIMAWLRKVPQDANWKLEWQDTQLALIHIPRPLYTSYLHHILKLLLPDPGKAKIWPFINISVTPIEASIVLPRVLATELFDPFITEKQAGNDSYHNTASITTDDFILICVTGSGESASQRVIDLTTPLALAGISIFFITTYFNDWILVPRRSQSAVIAALEARGFGLSEVIQNGADPSQGISSSYTHRPPTASSDGSNSQFLAPGTPPPSTLPELQVKTFATLRKRNIAPAVDETVRLVQCAGMDSHANSQSLLIGIINCLVGAPKFLSLTLTEGEAPSLLLETRFLPFFVPPSSTRDAPNQSILLGVNSDVLIPIVLDLRTLPLESTGIVCGIAGRLVGATKYGLEPPVEMSYLSTARSGGVIVEEKDLSKAVEVLGQEVAEGEGEARRVPS